MGYSKAQPHAQPHRAPPTSQVEGHLEEDDDYEAMCDITATMSCTAVFKSSYAHLFSHWGLVPKGHFLDLSLAILGLTLYGAYFVAACLWAVIPSGLRSRLFLTAAVGGACPGATRRVASQSIICRLAEF